MTETEKTLLFVYGTLCRGLSRNEVLRYSDYRGPAQTEGVLTDMGQYPALIPGEGTVIGEVYEIADEDVLDRLDEIEGYKGDIINESLYRREKRAVRLFSTGEWAEASLYVYNQPASPAVPIPGGDYRRYILDRHGDVVYYLAFGSNLDTARMEERVGTWKDTIPGYLKGFRLKYNKRPETDDGYAFANAVAGIEGVDIPCVAYHVERFGLMKLDAHEKVPTSYIRTVLPMTTRQGNTLLGHVYLANPDMIVADRKPSDPYRQRLLNGYRIHGLGDLADFES
ncbi:MAG: gamma-glutamylcyclotransferase [Proteobacteria bacterium]|nr:gamma-glutamylcyclotransferase [Pseudomonadota bacterium]